MSHDLSHFGSTSCFGVKKSYSSFTMTTKNHHMTEQITKKYNSSLEHIKILWIVKQFVELQKIGPL